jgi:hypothetical protein
MDTESMYWIGIVVFAAVTFSILAFTAGKLSRETKTLNTSTPSDSEVRAELVALRLQIEDLRFELRRSRNRG